MSNKTGPFRRALRSGFATLACAAFIAAGWPEPLYAQGEAASGAAPNAQTGVQEQVYTNEQLDALLAPIALYPDDLLTQVLMASTYPLQVVDAYRWLQQPGNKEFTGDALTKALESENWDPSVKSLVPFPQVLTMMNDDLDWMQQVGYAVTTDQADVLASVQRLRTQAQNAGHLQSTPQQTVSSQGQTIIIEPAQPNVVYVPTYNPTVVYGTWPYPAYPPVYMPPPPYYYPGQALLTGMAFGAGIAITAGLWGWASPNWHSGNVNVNVNRYNNINVNRNFNGNRQQLQSSNWNPPSRPQGNRRPPPGPVGQPGRTNGLPAKGGGRPSVSVPGNIARPPAGMGPNAKNPAIVSGNRPSAGQGGTRPNMPTVSGGTSNLGSGSRQAGTQRPSTGQRSTYSGGQRTGGASAFSGMNQGRSAGQFSARGAQSRQFSGGGGMRGGGMRGGGRR